jgi:3-oxoisoapionate kinase
LNKTHNILLAFYGDDMTGSTDALEFISRAGARTVLFMRPPTDVQLERFPELQAYGVAGLTRSVSPDRMEQHLLPAFETMKESGARHVHYKVCSTFDSSAKTGSIGKAIDCGSKVFGHKLIPVLGGMPALGRYCVFGNLFARMGIGSKGAIYRIDRHPSMRFHPVTPAEESDLRLHLGLQTKKQIGLIDVLQLEKEIQSWNEGLQPEDEVVLIDALTADHLEKIGAWLENLQNNKTPLFSVGSSGIEWALGRHWNQKKQLSPVNEWPEPGEATPLLVLSGSCSPVTKKQIDFALENGFKEVPLVMETFEGTSGSGVKLGIVAGPVLDALKNGRSVIIHTGNITGLDVGSSAELLGKALGGIGKSICEQMKIKRVVVAGGDTSSYAARAMEIDAVEMIAPFVSGAPLCRAHSSNKAIDGLEVNFKGGQVGGDDYFIVLREGRLDHAMAMDIKSESYN